MSEKIAATQENAFSTPPEKNSELETGDRVSSKDRCSEEAWNGNCSTPERSSALLKKADDISKYVQLYKQNADATTSTVGKDTEAEAHRGSTAKQDLQSPDGRRKVIEGLVNAGQSEDAILSSDKNWADSKEQEKAAQAVLKDVRSIQTLMSENGITFEQAYEKNEKFKKYASDLTPAAEDAVSGLDRAESMQYISEKIAQLDKTEQTQLAKYLNKGDSRWSIKLNGDELSEIKFSNSIWRSDLIVIPDANNGQVKTQLGTESFTGMKPKRIE